jgi:hypothetical protein
MPNESKAPEEYVSEALDLMVKVSRDSEWIGPTVENSQWTPLVT